ncbi:hypothetical protein PHYBOEH_002749 [Phytophthora boehmeriae]|uniref:Uncharacterized protein n=1 Tax=Phytophthora boehmeriae TaxID=109152 RepID=A0A8T1WRS5_9STRA|nr:hypothetical protein PHYBOEH_002749 [Phytophthora boehmeriae]
MALTVETPSADSPESFKMSEHRSNSTHFHARSSAQGARATERAAHRIRLNYRDEAYRLRTEARTKCLIADASSPSSSSTSALLAKKALKYRKVYDRMSGVDVNDPNFDVFEFLGVDWCKATTAAV